MIVESLKAANSAMLDSIQATNDKQAAKIFKEQIFSLGTLTPQLEQLLSIIEELKEKHIAEGIFTQEIKDSLLTTINNCGEKTNDHSLDVATVLALKNAINLCRTATETAWKEAAEKQSESVSSSLSALRSLLADKKEADELLEIIDEAKVKIPTSAKSIQNFIDTVSKGKAIIDNLHLDKEAEQFVAKVKNKKATVGDLTPHIMEWIRDNNLMNILKVRFGE
jgi:hypothetical protein